jgi:hypothetical protein
MRARHVVIVDIFPEDTPEMALIQNQQAVKAILDELNAPSVQRRRSLSALETACAQFLYVAWKNFI